MTDVALLDRQISEVEDLIREAGHSLLTLVDEDTGDLFLRDTRNAAPGVYRPGVRAAEQEQTQGDAASVSATSAASTLQGTVTSEAVEEQIASPPKFSGATSTNRAVIALFELLRFLAEKNEARDSDLVKDVIAVLAPLRERYLSDDELKIRPLRFSKDNDFNVFTDSHFINATLLMGQLDRLAQGHVKPMAISSTVSRRLTEISDVYTKLLEDAGIAGARLDEQDPVHDFLTLYAVRALDASSIVADKALQPFGAVADRVLESVLHQLAYDTAGIGARFDPAELTFSLAVLNRFHDRYSRELTQRGIKSVVDAQRRDGSWAPARPVSYKPSRLLHIASYEVALALADLLLRDELTEGGELFGQLAPALERSVELIRGNRLSIGERSGWTNDQTRAPTFVESWATAIVLSFLVHWRDVLLAHRQRLILLAYRSGQSRPQSDAAVWPDMQLSLFARPVPAEPAVSDPTAEGTLAQSLQEKLISPVLASVIRRPTSASFVIYGPPGSRKTSLVKAIAECLDWPLVILSPPDFLRDGLDEFERRAAEIFNDLMRLRRVVLLFDECEPFFLRRSEKEAPETRTQGAFITAGMLPRLQDLRDQRWIIFALATNVGPSRLDPAVTRPGRFDFQHHQGYPVPDAQVRYVAEALGLDRLDQRLAPLRAVCEALDGERGRTQARNEDSASDSAEHDNLASGQEAVSFQALDALIRIGVGDWLGDSTRLSSALRKLVAEGPPTLVDSGQS